MTYLFSQDDDLPNREGGYRTWLKWDDGRVMLTFREMECQRGDPFLVRFQLVGDSQAEFMDLLSERADAGWRKDQEHFLEHPRVHCRVCQCEHPASLTCETCRGTGWITLEKPEAERIVRMRTEHHGKLIEAAYLAAADR
jgi:hypothetical protein